MFRNFLFASTLGALAMPLFGTPASAQMSSEEIYRRLELQSQSVPHLQDDGQTRGMQLNYGLAPTVPSGNSGSVVTGTAPLSTSPSVAVFDSPQPGATIPAYETTTRPSASGDDPVGLFYPSTTILNSVESGPVPQSVALETYTPVQEQARIDLRVYFEWNSAALRPEAIGQLAELCSAVRRVPPNRVFKIIGHTDKSGEDAYNLYLSQARAREVKRHLVEECAVPEGSLLAVGEGERQSDPNSPQKSPDERRVEVQLIG